MQVTNHVLTSHPEVQPREVLAVCVELSCQLCLLVCPTEAALTQHIHSRHAVRVAAREAREREEQQVEVQPDLRDRLERPPVVARKPGGLIRYGSISPPPRSRTRSPAKRSPARRRSGRSRSRSRGFRRSRSRGRRSRSRGRRSISRGRRSSSRGRRSISRGRRSRSRGRRSKSYARSPSYSPYRRPRTVSRSPYRSPDRARLPVQPGRGAVPWCPGEEDYTRRSYRRSPRRSITPEVIENREERKEDELQLLERLKQSEVDKVTAKEDREKLKSSKCLMLGGEGMKQEGEEKKVCPFCSNTFSDDSALLEHLKVTHRRDMFGCSKCQDSAQPAIGWSVEVLLQHLATAHELNVSISAAISSFLVIPSLLHRVTCRLCPPPHILGSQGFWLGGEVAGHMVAIEEHFEQVHLMTEKTHVVAKLELACRGCDFSVGHGERVEWEAHMKRNHARLNRPESLAKRTGPRKRCDFCTEEVVATEAVR